VHDFPDEATFLKPDERARVLRRLAEDKQASASHEDFQMTYLWQSLKDWKTYMFAIIYMGADGALYAFSLFVPSIINELGYTSTRANLLSVPPYALAAILTITAGWYADRTQRRGLTNIVVSISGIVGFSMLLGSDRAGVKYAGTFLGAAGIYPCIANT
jgi:nitrate/nitrite transporter NarK